MVEFLGLQAGDMLTLFGLAVFLGSVGGAVGLGYTSGQPISDTMVGCSIDDAAPAPVLNSSDIEHSHTCVCQWPTSYQQVGDDGSFSGSGSGSWAS